MSGPILSKNTPILFFATGETDKKIKNKTTTTTTAHIYYRLRVHTIRTAKQGPAHKTRGPACGERTAVAGEMCASASFHHLLYALVGTNGAGQGGGGAGGGRRSALQADIGYGYMAIITIVRVFRTAVCSQSRFGDKLLRSRVKVCVRTAVQY